MPYKAGFGAFSNFCDHTLFSCDHILRCGVAQQCDSYGFGARGDALTRRKLA
jgi:hypothetical protein